MTVTAPDPGLPPVAAGIRAPWKTLPAAVRERIAELLGSPVVGALNQAGGFSPGLAARVRTADGRRAFVKAVGPEINPESPGILRAEIAVARHLPGSIPAPRLRGFAGADGGTDEGLDGWVVLVFEELDASLVPTPWTGADVRRALTFLDDLAAVGTPSPVPDLVPAADRLAPLVGGYADLAADPPADLDPWERRHLDRLADLGLTAVDGVSGDSLVHFDVRADNLMVGREGSMWLIDWPWACVGAPWIDGVTVLLDVAVYGGDPDAYYPTARTLADADPDAVTALIAGLAGMFAHGSRRPDPPGLPTLRAFQRANHRAALTWLRRRLPTLP
jgi:hypothetical protein